MSELCRPIVLDLRTVPARDTADQIGNMDLDDDPSTEEETSDEEDSEEDDEATNKRALPPGSRGTSRPTKTNRTT